MKKLSIFGGLALPLLLQGQVYQNCLDNATTVLNNCLADAEATRVASYATADAHYNDCIDPFSKSTTGVAGCYADALQKCGTDNTCLTTERNNCDAKFLGPAGTCKTVQTGAYAAADAYKKTQTDACYAAFSQQTTDCLSLINGGSPIVIDVTGEGFWLTDKQHGVKFKRTPTGALQQMSWTDPKRHNAWLVRPNANGSVTSLAANLFGNLSPQAPSATPNGYLALSYWMEQVGCGKGLSRLDSTNCPAVWNGLRLWQDANQDGVAQPGELHTLTDLGVYSISLRYHQSRHTDQYGNVFRYVAHIWDAEGVEKDNRCYDVFLLL